MLRRPLLGFWFLKSHFPIVSNKVALKFFLTYIFMRLVSAAYDDGSLEHIDVEAVTDILLPEVVGLTSSETFIRC